VEEGTGSVSNLAKTVEAGTTVREGFGETAIERKAETASAMVTAQAQAEIQARYVMAVQHPRDDDNVRVRLLRECKRPNFAKRAFYSLPKGDKPGRITGTANRIEGLSIRFAEAAIRIAGNIWQPTRTIYDDDFKRMVNVAAIDLETNAIYSRDVVVEKTVERSKPRSGAVILGKRTNSAGNEVYIVQATEEEILQKESNLVSRMLRTEALRLIGADTLEECEVAIFATIKAADAADPDGARKEIADAFATINVMPSDLKMYLGHELDQCSPPELTMLRALFAAIREGEVAWAEALREKLGVVVEGDAPKETKTSAAKSVATRLQERAERLRQAKEQKEKQKAAPAASQVQETPSLLSPEEQEKLRAAEANAKAKREETAADREPGSDDV
jgi:hypothetical protein